MIARNQNIEFAATDLNAQRKWRYVVNNNFGDVRIVAYNGCLDGGTTSNYTKEYTLLTRNKGKKYRKKLQNYCFSEKNSVETARETVSIEKTLYIPSYIR